MPELTPEQRARLERELTAYANEGASDEDLRAFRDELVAQFEQVNAESSKKKEQAAPTLNTPLANTKSINPRVADQSADLSLSSDGFATSSSRTPSPSRSQDDQTQTNQQATDWSKVYMPNKKGQLQNQNTPAPRKSVTVKTADGTKMNVLVPTTVKDEDINHLQNRIQNKAPLPEDVELLSTSASLEDAQGDYTRRKSKSAVEAYIKEGALAGAQEDRIEEINYRDQNVKDALADLSRSFTKYSQEDILSSPSAAREFMDYFERLEAPEKRITGTFSAGVGAGAVSYETDEEYNARPDVAEYNRQKDSYLRIKENFQKVVEKGIADKVATGQLSKDDAIRQIADLRSPKAAALADESDFATSSTGALAFSITKKALGFGDNKEREDMLNIPKGIAEGALNQSIEELVIEKSRRAVKESNPQLAAEAQALLQNHDPKYLDRYPTLKEQRYTAELTDYISKVAGNVEGADTQDVTLKVFGDQASKLEYARRYGREKGLMNDPIYKKILEDINDSVDKVGESSYLGGAGKSFADVFINQGKGLMDMVGWRTNRDIAADAVSDIYFPQTAQNLTKTTEVLQNISNTTAQVGAFAASQFLAGRGLGRLNLPQQSAQRTASLLTGTLTSYDGHYKDAMQVTKDPAARTFMATTNAIVEGVVENIFNEAKLIDKYIPNVRKNISDIATKIGTKDFSREVATELLEESRSAIVDFGKKYAKNIWDEGREEVLAGAFSDLNKMMFGDPDTDVSSIIKNAGETFIQTAIGTAIVGAWGAHADRVGERNSSYKKALYDAAVSHDATEDAFRKGMDAGMYDQQEFNSKMQILNTARKSLTELPQVERVMGKELGQRQRQVYVANRTAEAVLQQELEAVGDNDIARQEIEGKITSLKDQRKRIFGEDLQFDEAMNEVPLAQEETPVAEPVQQPAPTQTSIPSAEIETARQENEIAARQAQDEVYASIKQERVAPVLGRMNNAEEINEKELDDAADNIYEALDRVEKSTALTDEQKSSYRNLLEPLISKIEGYEFRTKTETRTVTETTADIVPTAPAPRKEIKPALEQSTGSTARVANPDGTTTEGTIAVVDGNYVLQPSEGDAIVIGEKASTDTRLSLPDESVVENPIEMDEVGNVSSITFQAPNGALVTVTDPEKALDLAIQLRAEQIGEVPQPMFDLVFNEIQRNVTEEVLVNDQRPIPATATATTTAAAAAPATESTAATVPAAASEASSDATIAPQATTDATAASNAPADVTTQTTPEAPESQENKNQGTQTQSAEKPKRKKRLSDAEVIKSFTPEEKKEYTQAIVAGDVDRANELIKAKRPSDEKRTGAKKYTKKNLAEIADDTDGRSEREAQVLQDAKKIVRASDATVTIHEDQESYAKAIEAEGGDAQFSNTSGFYVSGDGSEVHINMEAATSEAVFHEGAHPLLDRLAEERPEVIGSLYNQLEELAQESDIAREALQFGDDPFYGDDPVQAKKEAIVQFMALVADNNRNLQPSLLDRIKTFVDNVLGSIGIPSMFKERIADVDDIRSVASKFTAAINYGRQIRIVKSNQSMGNTKVPSDVPSSGRKLNFSFTTRDKKMFANIKRADISDFAGKTIGITASDRLSAGTVSFNGKSHRVKGGIFYPLIQGKFLWASSDAHNARVIIEDLVPDKDGYAYMALMSMGRDSHMSNYNSLLFINDLLRGSVENKRVTKAQLVERVNKAARRTIVNDRMSLDNILKSIEQTYSVEAGTFEERKPFLQSLLGGVKETKKPVNWAGLPTYFEATQMLAEPALANAINGDVVAIIRTKKDALKVVPTSPEEHGEDFHESYPFAIEHGGEIEYTLLNEAAHVSDVMPEFKNKGGKMVRFSDYLKTLDDPDLARRRFTRQVMLSDPKAPVVATQGKRKVQFSKNTLKGKDVATGKPVAIDVTKNTEKAPYLGSRFGQDVEPAGNYVIQKEVSWNTDGWVNGVIEFKNPLVIDVAPDTLVQWKRDLSKQYENKTGKSLTNALKKEGFDGIITRNGDDLGEIIAFENSSQNFESPLKKTVQFSVASRIPAAMSAELTRIKAPEAMGEGQTFHPDGRVYDPAQDGNPDVVTLASQNVAPDELTPDRVLEFAKPYAELLSMPEAKVGVFHLNTGEISIDLNVAVDKKYRDNTIAFAKANNQEAIWSYDEARTIPTDGNGDTTIKTTAEVAEAARNLIEGKAHDFTETLQTNKTGTTQGFFSDVVTGKSEKFKPKKEFTPVLQFTGAQEKFKEIYDKFKGNFDTHIATSIPTFRELQVKVGDAIAKTFAPPVRNLNPEMSALKEEYNRKNKVTTPQVGIKKLSTPFMNRVADFHDTTEDDRQNPEVVASYRAFMEETRKMYDMLVEQGYKIEPYLGEGEPYGVDSDAVRRDIQENKHLFYLMSRKATGQGETDMSGDDYILFENTGIELSGQEVVYNDLFRAVHDVIGHGMQSNNTFSSQGEFNAYLTHSNMYSPLAQKALFLETVSYNAWYNNGQHLRRPDGTIPKKGDPDYDQSKYGYAPRKLYVVPDEFIQEARRSPLIYDIGGSEGGFVKAITSVTGGNIRSINLDVNPDMREAHNRQPVEGSQFVQQAYYEGYTDEDTGITYPRHIPQEKADVVHESMVFQFISPEREQFIKEAATNYLREDGVLMLEEKLLPATEEEWRANEAKKDSYKLQYYPQEAITEKAEQVLVGMKANQTSDSDLLGVLNKYFKYVSQYWDSGNFKGYMASNDRVSLSTLKNKIGDTTSEFTTRGMLEFENGKPKLQFSAANRMSYAERRRRLTDLYEQELLSEEEYNDAIAALDEAEEAEAASRKAASSRTPNGNTSSVKNKSVEEKRRELNVGGATQKQTRTDVEVRKMADDAIKDGFNVQELIDDVLENKDQPTDVEIELIGRYVAGKEAEIRRLNEEIEETAENGDDLTPLMIERDAAVQQLNDAYNAARQGGTETARALRYRRQVRAEDESLAAMFLREADSSGVTKLTPEQIEKVTQQHKELMDIKIKYEKKIRNLEAQNRRLRADKGVQEVKKTTTKKQGKTKEDFKKERQSIIDNIKNKWKQAGNDNTLSALPLPYVKQLAAISPDVAKLVKSLVEEGITSLDTIIDNIHADLKGAIPEITREDVRDVIAGDYKKPKETRDELAQQVYDLKKQAQLQKKLEDLLNGNPQTKTSQQKINWSREVQELQKQIYDFRKTLREAEREQRLKTGQRAVPEKKALELLKSRTKSEIERLEKRIANKDFDPDPAVTPLKLDKEAIDLRNELIKKRKEIEIGFAKQELAKKKWWGRNGKVVDIATEILNVPRTLMASMDFSAPLRQGITLTFSHPVLAGKAFVEMFRQGFSEARYDRWLADLQESPIWSVIEESKLYVANQNDPHLAKKEERFMSNLVGKIPLIGKMVGVSERAYSSYLNKMRVDLFKQGVRAFQRGGKTIENNKDLYRAWAQYVNNATGRGHLGKLEEAAQILNNTFFSPRLIASRVTLLNPLYYAGLPKEVRVRAISDLALFGAFAATILGLTRVALGADDDEDDNEGVTIEYDPRSTDFAKIKFGNTRWDILGGFQQYIRFAAQMTTGEVKTTTGNIQKIDGETFPFKTRWDGIVSFFRGKLAPVPALVVNMAAGGENIIGEKMEFGKTVWEYLTPMVLGDAKDAVKELGWARGLGLVTVPAIFGVSASTYMPRANHDVVTSADKIFQNKGVGLLSVGNKSTADIKKYVGEDDPKHPEGRMTDEEWEDFGKRKADLLSKKVSEIQQKGIPVIIKGQGRKTMKLEDMDTEQLKKLKEELSSEANEVIKEEMFGKPKKKKDDKIKFNIKF